VLSALRRSGIENKQVSDFHGFVQNYNMQSMGKTLSEVHQMLIEYEKGGRVQKKPHGKAKGKGKAKGGQYSYPSKTKKPQPQKKERPAKEGQCHHCKEVGHLLTLSFLLHKDHRKYKEKDRWRILREK
nr:hypothetical protein [Tanacetum cinerariifolium]